MSEANLTEEEFRSAMNVGAKPVSIQEVQKIMFNFPEVVRVIDSPESIKLAGKNIYMAHSSEELTFTMLREFSALYMALKKVINGKDEQSLEEAKEYILYLEATLGEALKNFSEELLPKGSEDNV